MWGYIMSEVSMHYIVSDVDEAIPFYTKMLGFQVDMHPAPGYASLSRGDLRLLLSRPGAGGAGQAMPDGQTPAPGGWNRIQIEVEDLAAISATRLSWAMAANKSWSPIHLAILLSYSKPGRR